MNLDKELSLKEYEKLSENEKQQYYEHAVDDYLREKGMSKEEYDKEVRYGHFQEEGRYYAEPNDIPSPELYNPKLSQESREELRDFMENKEREEREVEESRPLYSAYNRALERYFEQTGISIDDYNKQCEQGHLIDSGRGFGYQTGYYENPELVPEPERFNPHLTPDARDKLQEIYKERQKEQEKDKEKNKEKDKKKEEERKAEIKKYAKEKNKYCRENNISFKEYDRNVSIGGALMPSAEQYNPDRSKEEREDIANRDVWKDREAEKAAYEKEVSDYLRETGMSRKDYTYQCTHAESPKDYPGPEHKNLNHWHMRDEIKDRDMAAEREFEKQYQKDHKDDRFKDDGERQAALKQKISDRDSHFHDRENERYEQEKDKWCKEHNVSYREYDSLRDNDPDLTPYPERFNPEINPKERDYIENRGDNIWAREENKAAYEKEVSDYLRETGMSREDYTYQCINSDTPQDLPYPEQSNKAHTLDTQFQLIMKDKELERDFEKQYQKDHKDDRFKDDEERQEALKEKSKERDIFIKEKEHERYEKERDEYCKENNISQHEYEKFVNTPADYNIPLPYPERLNPERDRGEQEIIRDMGPLKWNDSPEKAIYEKEVSDYLKETGMSREDYNYQCLNATHSKDYPYPEQLNSTHEMQTRLILRQKDPEIEKEFEKKYQKEHKDDRFKDDRERQQALKEKNKERDIFIKEREKEKEQERSNKEYDKYHKEVEKYCKENNMSLKEYEVNVKIGEFMTPSAEQYNPDKSQEEREFARNNNPWEKLYHENADKEREEYQKGVDNYLKKTGMSREDYNYQCTHSRGPNDLPKPEQKNANHWLDKHFEQRNLRDEIKFEKQYQKEHKDDRFKDDKEREQALRDKIKERDNYLRDREQARERNPIAKIRDRIGEARENIKDRINDYRQQREERETKEQQRMELKREERRYEKEVKAFCKENNMTRAEYNHSRLVPGEQSHLTPEFHSPHNTHLEKMDLFNRYSEDLNRDFEESKVPNSTISYEKCVKEMDKIYEHEVTAYCRENDITRAEYNVRAKENPERFSPEQLNRNQPLQVRNNIIEREARDVKTERDVIIKENERKYERMKEQPEARSEDKKQDKTHEIYHNLYERGIEKYCEEHNIENRNEYNNHIANLEREGKALPEHEALNTNRPPEERIQIIEAAREQQKAHEQIEHTHEREMPERASCPDR